MTDEELATAMREAFAQVWADEGKEEPVAELEGDTVLLETGLDSLGFAIFISELEIVLGYDPFVLADESFYPRTFSEFLAFYQQYAPESV